MPHLPNQDDAETPQELQFPPVTKDHIQNCSYDAWFPRYKSSCLKSRIIPLSSEFISYLHEDGIILADEDEDDARDADEEWHPATLEISARPQRRATVLGEEAEDSDESSEEEEEVNKSPPNKRFPELHNLIKEKIAELGGAVAPKLNWSSPKDAKWISPHQNTLKCTSPDDIYLLLKSSLFVSHDLSRAFDDTTAALPSRPFAPILVLRPFFSPHVALEFRCFVKHRALIGITQRDLNFYPFLDKFRPQLWRKIRVFFRETLRLTFPDSEFVFDVYIPENSMADDKLGKVRLIDINPWAPRTDSLLFGWEELLEMEVRRPIYGALPSGTGNEVDGIDGSGDDTTADETDDDIDNDVEYRPDLGPELRIIEKDDPAAFNFMSPQYSAHKLPKEVVDASLAGGSGLREFAEQWKELTEGRGGRA